MSEDPLRRVLEDQCKSNSCPVPSGNDLIIINITKKKKIGVKNQNPIR